MSTSSADQFRGDGRGARQGPRPFAGVAALAAIFLGTYLLLASPLHRMLMRDLDGPSAAVPDAPPGRDAYYVRTLDQPERIGVMAATSVARIKKAFGR